MDVNPNRQMGAVKAGVRAESLDAALRAADAIAAALQAPRRQVRDPDGIIDLLHQRGVRAVPWEGWEAIEALEIAAGKRRGAKQVKVADRELLLAAALSRPSPGR